MYNIGSACPILHFPPVLSSPAFSTFSTASFSVAPFSAVANGYVMHLAPPNDANLLTA